MSNIINPILKGFNPDPSICRVKDDYYIATSTFEWFPGVQIHHSKDLVHWKLITRPLKRLSQLNMLGNPNSGGIWAPCLTYDNGTFYLVYSDVKSNNLGVITYNYLVTSDNICGDWSDPIYLNSTGFDPSLFHDRDGRKWLLNMEADIRENKTVFAGILIQEYSLEKKSLIGPIHSVFSKTKYGTTEGPHLYFKNGYYYLIVAQGGTGYGHMVSMARSKSLTGPYEPHPQNPVLSSRSDFTLPLQKAGHADIVETPEGKWYMVHLCSRPITQKRRCVLGRETAIQKVVWKEDGWLYLEHGTNTPQVTVPSPKNTEEVTEKKDSNSFRDEFDRENVNIQFQSLRIPMTADWISLKERNGWLRMWGREELVSLFRQSLIACRQQSFQYTARTCLEFHPEHYRHRAGLICYYNTENYYYLYSSYDNENGQYLDIAANKNGEKTKLNLQKTKVIQKLLYLGAEVDNHELQFIYSTDNKNWQKIGPVLLITTLSDEYVQGQAFTGAFVGICCQDSVNMKKFADFDWFEYLEK